MNIEKQYTQTTREIQAKRQGLAQKSLNASKSASSTIRTCNGTSVTSRRGGVEIA
jgi:hypothetical protein